MKPILRLLSLFSLLLFVCTPAYAQWSIRTAYTSSNPAGADTTITFSYATTTATDLLLCGIRNGTNTAGISSVSDSVNGAWSQAHRLDGTVDLSVYYFPNTASSGSAVTVTVTFDASSTGRTMACGAIAGIATTSPLDRVAGQIQNNPGTGTDAVTSTATAALTVADEYVAGFIIGNEEGITYTVGTGFTQRLNEDNPSGTTSHWLVEDLNGAAASTPAATATVSTTTVDALSIVVTFKPAVAASAAGTRALVGVGL